MNDTRLGAGLRCQVRQVCMSSLDLRSHVLSGNQKGLMVKKQIARQPAAMSLSKEPRGRRRGKDLDWKCAPCLLGSESWVV